MAVTDSAVAIGNLIARYAELIDTGDFDGVADLLGRAAVGADGALLSGRDAIRRCTPPPPVVTRTGHRGPST